MYTAMLERITALATMHPIAVAWVGMMIGVFTVFFILYVCEYMTGIKKAVMIIIGLTGLAFGSALGANGLDAIHQGVAQKTPENNVIEGAASLLKNNGFKVITPEVKQAKTLLESEGYIVTRPDF